MNLLPSCAHHIRRILRRATNAYMISDLLKANREHAESLEGRLHLLYPNGHDKVALHLEQLVYSHQQAQAHQDQTALQEITQRLLWWLGYNVDTRLASGNVFVVDDTIETLKLLTTLLTQAGYQTNSAFNGKLALEKIPSVNPDLILLDINLPDIDGHQVYHTLQECAETAHIPVIFLSGIDNPVDIQRYHQHKVGYLTKPFKPCDLIDCVSRYVESRSSVEMSTDDMFSDEFKSRQQQAQRLTSFPSKYASLNDDFLSNHLDSCYFFRATLDGRYLKISQAFSQLYGYESIEDMLSSITNLWEQCYADAGHRGQWSVCFQCPNELRTLTVRIRTKQHQILDVIENIALIQDSYKRNLFYQGYMRLASS